MTERDISFRAVRFHSVRAALLGFRLNKEVRKRPMPLP